MIVGVYFLAGLWGIADACWQTQINGLYGVLFKQHKEVAFSSYKLWESLGFLFAFVSQALGICIFSKVILVLVFLFLGIIGYIVLGFRLSYKTTADK